MSRTQACLNINPKINLNYLIRVWVIYHTLYIASVLGGSFLGVFGFVTSGNLIYGYKKSIFAFVFIIKHLVFEAVRVFEAVTVKNECDTVAKNKLLQSLDAFFSL